MQSFFISSRPYPLHLHPTRRRRRGYIPLFALGRLISKTDRNDRTTTYTYDAAGRLTSEKWLDE
ncbi:MAG: RHS repeat domain-containing protein, partial [Planctomycetia bacterium]|nr:RHS repeat domain-containing protein [Planctomycetia bacterium]